MFAKNYDALVAWYQAVFGLRVKLQATGDYHFSHLVNDHGVNIGIAMASEMGVKLGERSANSVVLQFEVENVKAFFKHVQAHDGKVLFGPSFDKKDSFWYGGVADIEGNPIWLVDKNCP